MKKFLLFALILLPVFANADLAKDLLVASDLGRGGMKDGLTWKSKVITTEDDETSEREFLIKALADDAFVEALAPARTKGEVYIFNDRNMWFYKPTLKKPVSISPRQKLTGQAANGDIASTHYARDYDPTMEKTETLNGKKTHVLLLKAKTSNLTYDQIRYWITDDQKLAVKAEFLSLQGTPIKQGTMKYDNTVTMNGKKIPFVSELSITDAKNPKNRSVIQYDSPKISNHPKSIFNVNNLSR